MGHGGRQSPSRGEERVRQRYRAEGGVCDGERFERLWKLGGREGLLEVGQSGGHLHRGGNLQVSIGIGSRGWPNLLGSLGLSSMGWLGTLTHLRRSPPS
jgi:hypothetical protein